MDIKKIIEYCFSNQNETKRQMGISVLRDILEEKITLKGTLEEYKMVQKLSEKIQHRTDELIGIIPQTMDSDEKVRKAQSEMMTSCLTAQKLLKEIKKKIYYLGRQRKIEICIASKAQPCLASFPTLPNDMA